MIKNETIVSERKCAPEAILAIEMIAPNEMAATSAILRRRPNAYTSAIEKKPAAASPDEKEQFLRHSVLIAKAVVKLFPPPNSTTSLGRARPKLSLRARLTIRPAPTTRTIST